MGIKHSPGAIIISVLKNQTGFTLIELLAVMSIVAVLAGIVSVSVAGSGQTSRDAQTSQDATTVESSAADWFGDQVSAEVLTPKTVSVFGISGIEQTISSKWPEAYISDSYSGVFTTTVTGSSVNSILLLSGEDSTTLITPKELLENFNAIDFNRLLPGGYIPDEPDGVSSLTSDLYADYLWLFQITIAAGTNKGSQVASRQVSVFKLTTVQGNEIDSTVDLTYVQIFGEEYTAQTPT